MQNGVHVGIERILVHYGLRELYPNVFFISCYNTAQPFVGIINAVKFRLLNPSIPTLFFSFYSKDELHSKDKFGVLAMEGMEFIQLPCYKEELVQTAEKWEDESLDIDSTEWQEFSQKACKNLLKQRLTELKHGNKFDLGNRILNPLRIACVNVQASPQKSSNQSLLKAKLKALKEYKALPEIEELLDLARICEYNNDDFLQTAKDFANLFTELADWQINTHSINKLISRIDRLNDTFKHIKRF